MAEITKQQIESIVDSLREEHPSEAETLKKEIERIVGFLPDVDVIRNQTIKGLKFAAEDSVARWKILASLREAVWELYLREPDREKREELYRLWDLLAIKEHETLAHAGKRFSEAEALEKLTKALGE
jgi:arylsulfatase A-like enzyme